ncbi:hypothetical protein HAALTHF_07820n [Vreelandella aquamarina]|nr:hypothetical protein HAALTHF_07820n [Halomonas axialensis]
MSQDDLLSQEEIDALLKGVSGDEEPSPASSKSQDETKFDRMTRRLNIGSYANVCMRLILLMSVLLVISATGYLT